MGESIPETLPYSGCFRILQEASVLCVHLLVLTYYWYTLSNWSLFIQSCSNLNCVLPGSWCVFSSFGVFFSCPLGESEPDYFLPNGMGDSRREEVWRWLLLGCPKDSDQNLKGCFQIPQHNERKGTNPLNEELSVISTQVHVSVSFLFINSSPLMVYWSENS